MKKICVVFGGGSVEHDISIITGMQLSKILEKKYNIEKIYINLKNDMFLASKIVDLEKFSEKKSIKLPEVYFSNGAVYSKKLINKKLFDVECVINCCHGGVGENGDLAGYFETNKIKCASAKSLPAHIAMDKNLTKQLVKDLVDVVPAVFVSLGCKYIDVDGLNDELIVKPNSLGSSIGVKACNKQNFFDQVNAIFEMNDDVLIENRIQNMVEYNQACFADDEELILSAIEQPISKSEFLTFDEKYKSKQKAKGTDRIIPAKISDELKNQINETTKKIYSRLNMNGVVRIDYIYDLDANKLYFNEINTIPGSLAFYLFETIGIDYISLVEKLIKNAPVVKNFAYYDTQILKDKKI